MSEPGFDDYQLVQVEWQDAQSNASWQDCEDLPSPTSVKTVGWLVKNEPNYIVLAGTFSPGHSDPFSETIAIPKGWVLVIRNLIVSDE